VGALSDCGGNSTVSRWPVAIWSFGFRGGGRIGPVAGSLAVTAGLRTKTDCSARVAVSKITNVATVVNAATIANCFVLVAIETSLLMRKRVVRVRKQF